MTRDVQILLYSDMLQADGGGPCLQDAGSLEALPSQQQAETLLPDAQPQQHLCDRQSELIAAQHLPEPHQQHFQQPSSTEAHQLQFPSRLSKPQSVVLQSQVQVDQPCYSSKLPSHYQLSDQQVDTQQQVPAPPVASRGMLNGRDQYEVLRFQSSLIPRQSHSCLTVPSQAQLSPLPFQPQCVQSVTQKSAFAASAISCQTPQAVSASQSAFQHDSVFVRQSTGHALINSRHQDRQYSMHRQLEEGEVVQGNSTVDEQGHNIRAEQEQPYDKQQPAILDCKVQGSYGTQGQGFKPQQQQPYTVAAMHQQHLTEHTVSRSPDGNSVTESQTVSSSSSHYEFSFRRDTSSSALPRPGISLGTFDCRADCCVLVS